MFEGFRGLGDEQHFSEKEGLTVSGISPMTSWSFLLERNQTFLQWPKMLNAVMRIKGSKRGKKGHLIWLWGFKCTQWLEYTKFSLCVLQFWASVNPWAEWFSLSEQRNQWNIPFVLQHIIITTWGVLFIPVISIWGVWAREKLLTGGEAGREGCYRWTPPEFSAVNDIPWSWTFQ